LEAVLGGGGGFSCDSGVGGDDVLCSLITGGEDGVVVGEEFQIGFQLVNELFGQCLKSIYSVLLDCIFKGIREEKDGMIGWGSEGLEWCHQFPVPHPGCGHGWWAWGRLCILTICRESFLYIFELPDKGFQEEGL